MAEETASVGALLQVVKVVTPFFKFKKLQIPRHLIIFGWRRGGGKRKILTCHIIKKSTVIYYHC